VELTTAIALGLLAARIPAGLVLAADCFLAVCAVPLAYVDAAVRRLPNALTGPAYGGLLLILALAAGTTGQWHSLVRAVLGGVVLAAAYWVIMFISPSAIGGGDVRLAASTGTALAWYGWTVLLAGVLAGYLLAACYGVVLLAARRVRLTQQIPFGPFMIAGAFLAIIAAPL
jgi:leader peptidase (prepilin peptidase)/N-methyltransferase